MICSIPSISVGFQARVIIPKARMAELDALRDIGEFRTAVARIAKCPSLADEFQYLNRVNLRTRRNGDTVLQFKKKKVRPQGKLAAVIHCTQGIYG